MYTLTVSFRTIKLNKKFQLENIKTLVHFEKKAFELL